MFPRSQIIEKLQFLNIHMLTFESSSERVKLVYLGQNILFKESSYGRKYTQGETGLIFYCIWMA